MSNFSLNNIKTKTKGSKKGIVIGGILLILFVIVCCCCLLSSISSLIGAVGAEGDTDVSGGAGTDDTGTGGSGTGTGTGTGGGFDGPSVTGCSNLKATFYGGPDFEGDMMSLGVGDWNQNDFHEGVYDDVESIKIDSGLKVTVYQDDNQDDSRGVWDFTQDVSQTPNKRIESIRITCNN